MIPRGVGRPTWAEVDLAALRHNFREVRRRLKPRVKVAAVVKANAYGHGAVDCSRALAAEGADVLCVATVEEGMQLREAGLRRPILLLGLAQAHEAPAVIRYQIEPALTTMDQARALARAVRSRRGARKVRVHMKIDTGMGRIGMAPAAAGDVARAIAKIPGLAVAGVFTHFAHADGCDRTLLALQVLRLRTAAQAVRASWPEALVHAANSAAVLEAPETHMDMVRPGLMLYGLYPASRLRDRARLKPALRWVTSVIEVKTVPAGTGLSYGHTFVTRRRSRIATLAVGYADGWPRALSNRGEVLVHGRSCPVVGRVCMDMCLVDVTRAPETNVGDEAVLIGRQGTAELTAEGLAQRLNTISYEILCAIGPRVPRVFNAPGR